MTIPRRRYTLIKRKNKDAISPTIKEIIMGVQYRVYKNSPKCSVCLKPMRYLYTRIASNRSVWKCRECNQETVTYGYPEEDESDPSKRPKIALDVCEYINMPGDNYEDRRIREYYLRLQDKQAEISGRGNREQVSTVYALHF